jgi:protein-disulfide isomerase
MRALLSLSLLLLSCATASGVTTPSTAVEPSPVVATYRDRQIRLAEVDQKASDDLQKLQDQIYELRTETAERLALEVLVAAAAKAAGLSEDAWLEQQLGQGVPAPTDAQMRALFEKAKGQLPAGVGFDDVKPQLKQAIEREGKTRRAREVFDELKKSAKFELVLAAPPKPRKNVEAVGPTKGEATAPITIVEFADFECPYCARATETVQRVLAAYPGKIRLVFRHFPLSFHPKAPKAAEASACADQQGKFWLFHDALFDSQELEVDAMKQQAAKLGLDAKRFDACLDGGQALATIKKDMAAGQLAGVTGTPAFFINGVLLSGAQPEEAFRKLIDRELTAKPAGP